MGERTKSFALTMRSNFLCSSVPGSALQLSIEGLLAAATRISSISSLNLRRLRSSQHFGTNFTDDRTKERMSAIRSHYRSEVVLPVSPAFYCLPLISRTAPDSQEQKYRSVAACGAFASVLSATQNRTGTFAFDTTPTTESFNCG
jgi:hypothetical protein